MSRLWSDRERNEAFRQAAEEAKRKLYPELYFSEFDYEVPACRVCRGVGAHTEDCKLRNPDKKEKAAVEDLLELAGDEEAVGKKREVETLDTPPAKPAKKPEPALDSSS